jgi:4-hydroxy-3-polyprenylbenzoate decarboxylase
VGIPPQEDAWIGKATERIFLTPIKMTMVPEIADMNMPVEGVFHNLVIATINKDYAGQGQKVMNAMWGAGQMMFNKILVLAEGEKATGIKIDDYANLAREVFTHLNPATDVYFSSGPMDVLDHSCSKMGFGGKLCIDGTRKTDEERTQEAVVYKMPAGFSIPAIQQAFAEIDNASDALLQMGIPVLLVAVAKNRPGHVAELHRALAQRPELQGIKMVLYVEHTVRTTDIADVLWRFCNNLDPRRDHVYGGPHNNILGLDGTRKTKKYDNFDRDWPNIIVADNVTIKKIDDKWPSLGIGELITSPSLRYKTQLYRGGATVLEDE